MSGLIFKVVKSIIMDESMTPLKGYQIRDACETTQEVFNNIGTFIDKMGDQDGIAEFSDVIDGAVEFLSNLF